MLWKGCRRWLPFEAGSYGVTSNCIRRVVAEPLHHVLVNRDPLLVLSIRSHVRTSLVDKLNADQANVHEIPESEVIERVMLARSAVERLAEPAEVAGGTAGRFRVSHSGHPGSGSSRAGRSGASFGIEFDGQGNDQVNQGLATYLNDHLGGGNAGIELARRLEEATKGGPDEASLDGLAEEIEEDVETLRSVLHAIGGSSSAVKQAAGWVAEKAHRLGTAADAASGGPDLARLLEAESLLLGVEGKRCLWVALLQVAADYPALAALDLSRLIDRAGQQRERVEAVRLAAAQRAFGTGGSATN
jgi:hypothetical protein